jgi:hypothetical protein
MKKIRLEVLEHLVGVWDEEELVKFAFDQIDVMVKQANEVLKDKGISEEMERPEILILNGKEYQKPR